MADLLRGSPWPRRLFWLCLLAAALLAGAVAAGPAVAAHVPPAGWGGRVAALFAADVTVRRTCVAAAVGLVATAAVFFRPPRGPTVPANRRRPDPMGA